MSSPCQFAFSPVWSSWNLHDLLKWEEAAVLMKLRLGAKLMIGSLLSLWNLFETHPELKAPSIRRRFLTSSESWEDAITLVLKPKGFGLPWLSANVNVFEQKCISLTEVSWLLADGNYIVLELFLTDNRITYMSQSHRLIDYRTHMSQSVTQIINKSGLFVN